MTEPRNLEARRLIADQLEAQGEKLAKLDRRLGSLETQRRKGEKERGYLKDEIAGLAQALEALGGPIPEPEPQWEEAAE